MTTTIKLGRGLDLPIEAVTQTFALLAKRGAGKTYAALKLAEGMLDAIVDSPGGITRDELAEAIGITRSGGTFGTYLSRIRSNGLIEEAGESIRPSSVLR